MTLPIIEQLEQATTDAERAIYCLRMSDDLVIRDWLEIERILSACGFAAGRDYAHARHIAGHATRTADGELPPYLTAWLEGTRAILIHFARGTS